MLAGVTNETFKNLQVDAGVLIEDLEYTGDETLEEILEIVVTAIDTQKCIGATRGGSTFISEAETRQIECDGLRVRFKGDMVKDSVKARIETNLLEFTVDNIQRIIPTAEITADETNGKVTYRERTRINTDTDYMKKLSWVVDRSDGGIIIFSLFNPMNTSGTNIAGADKKEAQIPVTFEAFNASFDDRDYAPYQVDMWLGKRMTTTRQDFKL